MDGRVIRGRTVGCGRAMNLVNLWKFRKGGVMNRIASLIRSMLAPVVVAGVLAFCSSIGVVKAAQWVIVDLPTGNSTGSAYLSHSSSCIYLGQNFSWGHSEAYSVENFINPARIHFKYLDYYGGWASPAVPNMQWGIAYLDYAGYGGPPLVLSALAGQSFYSVDITMWLWVYKPHYASTFSPFFRNGNDINCGSSSVLYFYP